MKKIYIFLFVSYLGFINCQHDFSFEEKLYLINHAMNDIAEKFVDVTNECDETFNAIVTFGVLFTNKDDFEKDLNDIKGFFSSNLIDIESDKDMESGLIEKEIKMDKTQQKIFIYKNIDHIDDKMSFVIIEVNFTNLNSDNLKCPFVIAFDRMLNNFDYDINNFSINNFKVVSFKYN